MRTAYARGDATCVRGMQVAFPHAYDVCAGDATFIPRVHVGIRRMQPAYIGCRLTFHELRR